jgi:hypothetical protein
MSYVFKACILLGAAIVIGAATVPNPALLFANATASFADVKASFADITASLADNLRLPTHTAQSTPMAQPTAEVIPQPTAEVTAPPPAIQEPASPIVIASSPPAARIEAENSEPPSDALFSQFQAWAAARDTHIVPQPVQDAPEVLQGPPARLSNASRHNRRVIRVARPEPSLRRNPRIPPQPVQNARAQVPPSLSAEPQWNVRSQ